MILVSRTVLGSMLFMLAFSLLAAENPLPSNVQADLVIVHKKEKTLTLLSHGRVLKTYKIALGGDPVGPKTRKGDHKTPEGNYVLDHKNEKSKFYRSIHISYPDAQDRARAAKLGVDPGGDIMIHGLPNGFGWLGKLHRTHDWTDGCIAVTDEEMDEIWRAVPVGTHIKIFP